MAKLKTPRIEVKVNAIIETDCDLVRKEKTQKIEAPRLKNKNLSKT
jgi:hypothetical protein